VAVPSNSAETSPEDDAAALVPTWGGRARLRGQDLGGRDGSRPGRLVPAVGDAVGTGDTVRPGVAVNPGAD